MRFITVDTRAQICLCPSPSSQAALIAFSRPRWGSIANLRWINTPGTVIDQNMTCKGTQETKPYAGVEPLFVGVPAEPGERRG
jgi:hypothetical protein